MMGISKESDKKRVVGYTTGVFDMFHIGHLNILKRAKAQCDYLIVGVSTDELMMKYKHRRPIVCFDERIAIVSAIRYVDIAVPQTSMNKYLAWEKLHFDVLFHGSDWQNTEMYEKVERDLSEVGVLVMYFPYTQGISSSILAEKIRKATENGQSIS